MQFFGSVYDAAVLPFLQDVPLLVSAEGALVAMFLLGFAAKFVHVVLSFALLGKFDNVQSSHRYSGKSDGSWTWQRLACQRAYSAHLNQLEAFVAFSVAMLLALQSKGSSSELAQLANAFLCVRVLYNVVFVCAFNAPLAAVRSAVWVLGFVIVLKIFSMSVPNINYSA